MKRTLIIFGILYLGVMAMSCSSEPKRWYKAGGTAAMYERDSSYCEEQTVGTVTTMNKVDTYTFESCMEQRGWVVLDKPAM